MIYSEALSTVNRWTFTKTLAANAADVQAGDVLGIVATNQVDAGEGNTITGADGQAALITHAADMGQGTITATA